MSKSSKGDITAELMLLKSLEGAAFGAKLKEIAGRRTQGTGTCFTEITVWHR